MFGLFAERKIGLSLSIWWVIRNQNAGEKIHMHVLHQIGHFITYILMFFLQNMKFVSKT